MCGGGCIVCTCVVGVGGGGGGGSCRAVRIGVGLRKKKDRGRNKMQEIQPTNRVAKNTEISSGEKFRLISFCMYIFLFNELNIFKEILEVSFVSSFRRLLELLERSITNLPHTQLKIIGGG